MKAKAIFKFIGVMFLGSFITLAGVQNYHDYHDYGFEAYESLKAARMEEAWLEDNAEYADFGFPVMVIVRGLQGEGLVLQNNGGDDLAIGKDGDYQFATELTWKAPDVDISILSQPTMTSGVEHCVIRVDAEHSRPPHVTAWVTCKLNCKSKKE